MTIEIFSAADCTTLGNPGVSSLQLLWPGNSRNAKATVIRVTVAPGAAQARHSHVESEQIWIVEQGSADLLLAGDETRVISGGHIVRTPAGDIHGLSNSGAEPFVYLAITTPPVDFRAAYQEAAKPSLKDLLLTDATRGDLNIRPRGMTRRRRPNSDSET